MGKGISYDEIKNYIEGEHGNGCILITTKEEAIKTKNETRCSPSNITLKIKCKCGNVFPRALGNFKKSSKVCPECNGIIKYNIKTVRKFVKNNSECELLSNIYENNSSPMKFKCNCQREFITTWAEFVTQNRRQCAVCGQKKSSIGRRKWNEETLSNFISKNTECQFIDYERIKKGSKTRVMVTLQCKCKAKNIFIRDIDSIKRRIADNNEVVCYPCSKISMISKEKHSIDFIKNEFIKQGYRPLFNNYKNANEKLLAKDEYGYKIYVTYHRFRQNKGNKIFHKSNPYTLENIKLYLKLNEPNYELLSNEYKSYSNDKLAWECGDGHQFHMSLDCFTRGVRCPFCSQSKGEKRVRKYLENNNFVFESEYEFKDLKGDYDYLRFDYAVFTKGDLTCLIEYDGALHYEVTTLKNDLEKQKRYDDLKNQYCKQNKIRLIRIPYWNFDNIEEILGNKLRKTQ